MFNISTQIEDWVNHIVNIIPTKNNCYNIIIEQTINNLTLQIIFYNVTFSPGPLVKEIYYGKKYKMHQNLSMTVLGKDNILYTMEFITNKGENNGN